MSEVERSDTPAKAGDDGWVRARIVEALWEGNKEGNESSIERQADAVMALLDRTASETDTFHAFVGYLNGLRLMVRDIEEDK
jgi:hypothetical protein